MHGSPHIVSDVMTRAVATVGRGAALKDIVRTMQQRKVSALPVLDRAERVIGIVSEADPLPEESSATTTPTGARSCAACRTSRRPAR